MSLSTQAIMDRSLALVGRDEVPGDSTVYVPGSALETALVGIDLGSAELQLAHHEGYELALVDDLESAGLDCTGISGAGLGRDGSDDA